MRVESYLIAEMLQCLEQQTLMVRPNAVDLAAALSKEDYLLALDATAALERVLEVLVTTGEGLRAHIVARDRMGEICESPGELALRASTLVIVTQLDILREELRDPVVQPRVRNWFRGRFQGQGIVEVGAFVDERLRQIHGRWLPYRRDQPLLIGMTDGDRAELYRTMIRVAQGALHALIDEPDLAQFLDGGLAATDLVQVHLACRQICSVLHQPVEVDPSRTRWRRSRRVAFDRGGPPTASGTPVPSKGRGNDTAQEGE